MGNEDKTVYDIAVVGGGPAGLAAAIMGRQRNKTVAVFEHQDFSPRLRKAPRIDNYPGLPAMPGADLIDAFLRHCRVTGPEFIREKVTNVFPGEPATVMTAAAVYEARAVILTLGVSTTPGLAGEREFVGRGVSYCATCDGGLYRGRDVAVVSYTAEGEEELRFLAGICRQVYFVPQYRFDGDVPANVTVLRDKVRGIGGKQTVEHLLLGSKILDVAAIFIARDVEPAENLVNGLAVEKGHIVVDRAFQTNIAGVFAAGDCVGRPYQVPKAVAEGQLAALGAVKYLDELAKRNEKTGA